MSLRPEKDAKLDYSLDHPRGALRAVSGWASKWGPTVLTPRERRRENKPGGQDQKGTSPQARPGKGGWENEFDMSDNVTMEASTTTGNTKFPVKKPISPFRGKIWLAGARRHKLYFYALHLLFANYQ